MGLRTFRIYTLISSILTKSGGLTNGETVLKISIEKVARPRALQSGTRPVFFSLQKPYNFAYIPTLIKS